MKTLSNFVPPTLKGNVHPLCHCVTSPPQCGGDTETKTLSNLVPPPLKGEGDRGRGFITLKGEGDGRGIIAGRGQF